MRRRIKRVAQAVGAVVVVLLGIMVVRALTVKSKQPIVAASATELTAAEKALDVEKALAHLAAAVRVRTISSSEDAQPEMDTLRDVLAGLYPRVHASMTREIIGHGLLFTWKGKNPSLPPVLLLAHMDVVPVDEGSLGAWTHPPFEGFIDPPGTSPRFIWGRGTLDDKSGVIGILEAAESLLGEGFAPERSILLAFGSDEEIGGKLGAVKIAEALEQRGVHARFALDEGGAVTRGIVPNLSVPVAVVGLAEKGYLTVDLSVGGLGGHSSSPPRDTAISIVATAVNRLVASPMPAQMSGPTHTFLEWTAPEMAFGPRLALTNQWITGRLVERMLTKSAAGGASIRTTTAPTLFHAGNADNVLPATATATMNFRVVPGDTTASVLDHVKETIADPRVDIQPRAATRGEPSPVSPADGPELDAVARTIREVFPDAIVAPGLTIGATDARRYVRVTNAAFRFLPVDVEAADLARMHGTNERLSVESLAKAVRFYRRLMRTTATAD